MEQHSIGQLMSALRKNTGFTQQEVADKLNVSNKTVSCWERDASSPDISMLPAIARLYGVTCDELLGVSKSSEPVISQTVPIQQNNAQGANDDPSQKNVLQPHDSPEKKLSLYEHTHKTACISAVFVTILALCAAGIALYFTDKPVWAFSIVVPVTVIAMFILALIQSRIRLLTGSSEECAAIRRRQYFRFKRTIYFMLLCFAFFLPYCANLDYSVNYALLGTASALLMLLLLIGVGLVLSIRYAQYYSARNRVTVIRRLIVYCTLFTIAIVTVFGCHIYITKQPLIQKKSDNASMCENIYNLEQQLTQSDLPADYVCNSAPLLSDQYAEYTYSVPKNKFRKEDLSGYLRYRVSGLTQDDTYTVHILYPIWNVSYTYTDPLTLESVRGTKQIIVTNREYQTANLEYVSSESYRLSNFDIYKEDVTFYVRNLEFTLYCAFGAAALMLTIYAVLSLCLKK